MNINKRLKMLALEHWNKIACGSTTERPEHGSCPYCKVFKLNGFCYGCPISVKTKGFYCINTSYYGINSSWMHAWVYYKEHYKKGKLIFKWQAYCADEIEAMLELIESLPED